MWNWAFCVSAEAAKGYLAREDLPPVVRTRIETFQAEAERQISRHRYSVYLSGGFSYQSNANLAPGDTILSFCTPTALPGEFASEEDFSIFANGRARYRYDFVGPHVDHLEAHLVVFSSRQFSLDDFNVTYASADLGQRMVILHTDGVSIWPYATASAPFIDDGY